MGYPSVFDLQNRNFLHDLTVVSDFSGGVRARVRRALGARREQNCAPAGIVNDSRIADLHHAALLAADSDPSIGVELERSEVRRLDDIHTGIGWFVHRGLLDANRATDFADILSYLTSPQTYRYSTFERHWSTARFTSWLRASIDSNLTTPP